MLAQSLQDWQSQFCSDFKGETFRIFTKEGSSAKKRGK